jgi:hypothetical protein
MNTPPQGEATPPFNSADHLIILTPDAPTRAATADSAPPWIAVARAPFGIHSRPVLDCVLQRSASIFFETFGLFSYGCWRCVGAGW